MKTVQRRQYQHPGKQQHFERQQYSVVVEQSAIQPRPDDEQVVHYPGHSDDHNDQLTDPFESFNGASQQANMHFGLQHAVLRHQSKRQQRAKPGVRHPGRWPGQVPGYLCARATGVG
ncbi:hypothetical protein D3C81_1477960 [compost metagenome]